MKSYFLTSLLMALLLGVLAPTTQADDAVITVTSPAPAAASSCNKCGEFLETENRCEEAVKREACGLHQGSPGCCKLPKKETAPVEPPATDKPADAVKPEVPSDSAPAVEKAGC